jgi:hypothetical protein
MNVMLSYRSTDAEFMEELATHLRKEGIKPWIDREGIPPATRWRDELLNELRSCDKFIAVLSPSYLQSEHCRMEVFIARSFGRPILPVMTEDCFSALRDHEETKGLEDIFMMRIYRLNAVGLPITREDAFRRISGSLLHLPSEKRGRCQPVYVSYSTPDGDFATTLAHALNERGIATWIATLDISVGENWRDAQARAMMQASSHLVVLDENMVHQNVLRTEILLSEARGLPTFTILPPRLNKEQSKVRGLLDDLDSSDQTYRRLAATQYFSCANGLDQVIPQMLKILPRTEVA